MLELFCAECKKKMYLEKISREELAKKTGYKKSTIDSFFAEKAGREKSMLVAKSISNVLNVEI